MAAPFRVGIIGLGDAGRHHARALLQAHGPGELRLAAVASPDPERREAACAALAVPADVRRFASLDELLAADACDGVILATPDGLHAEQVVRCAGRGVHVLCEKPLALTLEDGERAVAAVRTAGISLQVGYHLRHHAGHQLLRARLGELVGPVRSIAVRWAWPDPATAGWRARGHHARFFSLAALGTHAIDLALWLADAPVDAVAGLLWPPGQIDRAAELSLRFSTGTLASISVAVTHRAPGRVIVAGDVGEVECLGTLGARGEGELWWRPAIKGRPAEPLPFTPRDPYLAQLRAFVDSIGDRARIAAACDAALGNLHVLERIAAS